MLSVYTPADDLRITQFVDHLCDKLLLVVIVMTVVSIWGWLTGKFRLYPTQSIVVLVSLVTAWSGFLLHYVAVLLRR